MLKYVSEVKRLKNPLHYQISEYDCAPTSLLNAINFLFEREQITPDIIRNIMLYTLDCYDANALQGRKGTSRMATMFISHWLQGYGEAGALNVTSHYIRGSAVKIGQDSRINDALIRKGAVVIRLHYDGEHYVLLTGVQDDKIFMFDPYYKEDDFVENDIVITLNEPKKYNRIVPFKYFNRENEQTYSLGKIEAREAVLIFNTQTQLTPQNSIEYFI